MNINKKILLLSVFGFFILALAPSLESVGEISFCCEKTTEGAWCQNAKESECNTDFSMAPTSCEATGFCKAGTCVNTKEGLCMENTPEVVCNNEGGFWDAREPDEISVCQLGCCLIGDQAAFVTSTRCKSLSSDYGLEANFRTDFDDELECLAEATADVKGACVTQRDFERTCRMTTQKECRSSEDETEFHAGF